MSRLGELYQDRTDAVRTLNRLRTKLSLEPESSGRIMDAIEDVRSRMKEIDDDIFDLERVEGVGNQNTKGD